MKQDLFGERPPRRSPRVMMRIQDAGHLPGGGKGIRYVCNVCTFDEGWTAQIETDSQAKRGRPCPRCNAQEEKPMEEEAIVQAMASMINQMSDLLKLVKQKDGVDLRSLASARTNFEQGFMWLAAAVDGGGVLNV